MAQWELIDSGSIQHDVTVITALPSNDTQYGAEYVCDMARPVETWTFTADTGLTATELGGIKTAANTRNVVYTLITSTGESFEGRITALSWERTPGSDRYSASITLRSVAGEAASNLASAVSMAAPL